MKATKSKDGFARFTMRLEVRVGLQEVCEAVLWKMRGANVREELKAEHFRYRHSLIELTRWSIVNIGEERLGVWSDAYTGPLSEMDPDEAFRLVTEHVGRLFPELAESRNVRSQRQ